MDLETVVEIFRILTDLGFPEASFSLPEAEQQSITIYLNVPEAREVNFTEVHTRLINTFEFLDELYIERGEALTQIHVWDGDLGDVLGQEFGEEDTVVAEEPKIIFPGDCVQGSAS